MSSFPYEVKNGADESPFRNKKVAAKTIIVKSPHPPPNTTHDAIGNLDSSNSFESFKSAVNAEVLDGNDVDGNDHDTRYEAEDSIPPAPATKETLISKERRPKKKYNPTKTKTDPKGGFWEVDGIVDVRRKGRSYEYLVRWKGDYEDTWEPQRLLNPNALRDGKELLQAKLQQNKLGDR